MPTANFLITAAPTFCKCTCFKNSTIIPLGPEHQDTNGGPLRRASLSLPNLDSPIRRDGDGEGALKPRTASASCSECTKAFCLRQGISFCKGAEEDDVATMCFQRDSNKDRIIVWGFIIGTVGLLGWAGVKRVLAWREVRGIGRQGLNYTPVTGDR